VQVVEARRNQRAYQCSFCLMVKGLSESFESNRLSFDSRSSKFRQ
jgi:hypothetical protein